MKDYEKEILQKYLRPDRPFLHGMMSTFDMFGVLEGDRNEQLLANLQIDLQKRDRDAVRSAWRKVGESLYWAVTQYEQTGGGGNL